MLEHSSNMRKSERSPEVNSYVDDLARRMLEVCARYGVDHPAKLAPLIKNGTVAGEDVLRFRNLRLAWAEATAENHIPSVDREWKRRRAELAVREAVEAMGAENVLGPEKAAATFGLDLEKIEIPPVPFSRAELERARELGQVLVFRVSKAADGTPLSMKKMGEVLTPRFAAEKKGVVLGDTDWCKDDPFFKDEAPAAGWALVSCEVVPNTASKNFLQQTEELVRYLRNEAFRGAELPKKYVDAIAQFDAAKAGIATIIKTDWKKAAEKLEALDITPLLRPSPAEATYDAMLAFDHSGARPLKGVWTWTSRRSSDGPLVFVGYFVPSGLVVGRHAPHALGGDLGAAFARR